MLQMSLFDFFNSAPLQAYDVVCLPSMVGRKAATIAENRVALSPAMYYLYRGAEYSELIHLLKNIPVYVIGSRETIKHLSEAASYGKK